MLGRANNTTGNRYTSDMQVGHRGHRGQDTGATERAQRIAARVKPAEVGQPASSYLADKPEIPPGLQPSPSKKTEANRHVPR